MDDMELIKGFTSMIQVGDMSQEAADGLKMIAQRVMNGVSLTPRHGSHASRRSAPDGSSSRTGRYDASELSS
mgnify:CR=1 FL=1